MRAEADDLYKRFHGDLEQAQNFVLNSGKPLAGGDDCPGAARSMARRKKQAYARSGGGLQKETGQQPDCLGIICHRRRILISDTRSLSAK